MRQGRVHVIHQGDCSWFKDGVLDLGTPLYRKVILRAWLSNLDLFWPRFGCRRNIGLLQKKAALSSFRLPLRKAKQGTLILRRKQLLTPINQVFGPFCICRRSPTPKTDPPANVGLGHGCFASRLRRPLPRPPASPRRWRPRGRPRAGRRRSRRRSLPLQRSALRTQSAFRSRLN